MSERLGGGRRAWFAFAAAAALLFSAQTAFAQRTVTVGIVTDGPAQRNTALTQVFLGQIDDLLRGEFNVEFPEIYRVDGGWTPEGVQAALDGLLSDPEVDVVLAMGGIASLLASTMGPPPKPVFAPFAVDFGMGLLPEEDGRSGVRNLNYVAFVVDMSHELEVFWDVVPFNRISFLLQPGFIEVFPDLEGTIRTQLGDVPFEIDIVPFTGVDEALAALPDGTDAVYVAPLNNISDAEFERLSNGLIERRLPSFAVWGRADVERGLLFSTYPDHDFERIARRVALNLQMTLLGDDPARLRVSFSRGEELFFNMATARAINVSPSWDFLTEAVLINRVRRDVSVEWSPETVVETVLAENLSRLAAERDLAAGEEELAATGAPLLPQFYLDISGSMIDADRAEATLQPERVFTAGLRLEQLIYAPQPWDLIDIQEYVQLSREDAYDQLSLDLVELALVAYHEVLRAKILEEIELNNLRLTRSNLDLARLRLAVGMSGPADVHRWEAELASNRARVIDANALRNQIEIQLNTLLNRPAEESFRSLDVSDDLLPELESSVVDGRYYDTPASFRVLRQFLVEEAVTNSPELRQLDNAIEAQRSVVRLGQRSLYIPTIGISGQVFYMAIDGGSDGLELPPPFESPERDDVNWELAAFVTLPLWLGGQRYNEIDQAEQELLSLEIQRQDVHSLLEQRVRSAAHQAMSSRANIVMSRRAAQESAANLDLVSQSYQQGSLEIIQLLDAQNVALNAESAAANAVYNYLIDRARVERAVGQFTLMLTPEERAAYGTRIDTFFAAQDAE